MDINVSNLFAGLIGYVGDHIVLICAVLFLLTIYSIPAYLWFKQYFPARRAPQHEAQIYQLHAVPDYTEGE